MYVLSWVKFLHYFGNIRYNPAVLGAFVKFVKVIKYTGLKNTRYSLSASCWIFLYGLGHSCRTYGFRITRPNLIIKFLATHAKFLEPSRYNTVIIFTFHTANVFGCFHGIIKIYQLPLHKQDVTHGQCFLV